MASRLQALIEVGRVLSSRTDYPNLFRQVIEAACDCLEAEGGTFYLHDDKNNCLSAVVAINKVIHWDHVLDEFDPTNIIGLFQVPLGNGQSKESSVSGACFQSKKRVVINDTSEDSEYDLSNVWKFDSEQGYKTKSLIAVPLFNKDASVIGVLQLANAKHGLQDSEGIDLVEALASFLGIAVENNMLLLGTQNLLNAVVDMISSAIDERSKVTGGHCQKVTALTMMLAESMAKDESGPYKDFSLNEAQMRELRIAAQLHDIGKIATPDYVLQKSKKLENVRDNIHYLEMRFRIRNLEIRNTQLERAIEASDANVPEEDAVIALEAKDFEFVKSLNTGGEFLDDKASKRLLEIASKSCMGGDLIESDDLNNLLIERGTLNPEERKVMENHASISIRLLNKLPWPTALANVPEVAGKHHENCDGSGYPNGLTGDQMSLKAKVLALTDRFEGLSAPDREYREPKSLQQVMKIMGYMAKDNQIDPELYRYFVESGVYLKYARAYLTPEQLADGVEVTLTA